MIIKSVAFNPEDPDQQALLAHAHLRTNFSGYVKRLIQRDMEGVARNTPPPISEYEKTPNLQELVRGLI